MGANVRAVVIKHMKIRNKGTSSSGSTDAATSGQKPPVHSDDNQGMDYEASTGEISQGLGGDPNESKLWRRKPLGV